MAMFEVILAALVSGVSATIVTLVLASRRRPRLSFKEFYEIRMGGYDDGAEAAARIIEECTFDEDERKWSVRHSVLVRKLKRGSHEAAGVHGEAEQTPGPSAPSPS
jgi:hypothetical protein